MALEPSGRASRPPPAPRSTRPCRRSGERRPAGRVRAVMAQQEAREEPAAAARPGQDDRSPEQSQHQEDGEVRQRDQPDEMAAHPVQRIRVEHPPAEHDRARLEEARDEAAPGRQEQQRKESRPARMVRIRDRRVRPSPAFAAAGVGLIHRRPSGSDGSRSGPRRGILDLRTPAHDPWGTATSNLARHGASRARLPSSVSRDVGHGHPDRRRSDERFRIRWERWITDVGRGRGHDDRDGSDHDHEVARHGSIWLALLGGAGTRLGRLGMVGGSAVQARDGGDRIGHPGRTIRDRLPEPRQAPVLEGGSEGRDRLPPGLLRAGTGTDRGGR